MINNILSPHQKIKPSILFLAVAMLIGGFIRLSQVIQSTVPLNDGGLFLSMTEDLMKNRYRLPEIVSYNNLGIPFAYPPLSFYLAGGLADLTGWNLFDLLRIMPAVFAVLTIPAFFLLAREFINDEFQLILATLLFTFIPASFDWLIMGGGLTRSPGFFLALINMFTIYRLYTRKEKKYVYLTSLFAALTILTHPETALHTVATALVFFLFFGKNKAGIIKSFFVAMLTISLIMPWLGIVLARHGFDPFLAAGQTGWHGIGSAINLFQFALTDEYGLQIIAVLGLIGLFWFLAEKRFLMPVWLLVIFISEPRSAPLYISPVMAILASYSLVQILHNFQRISKKSVSSENPFSAPISRITFAILLGQWIFSAYLTTIQIVNTTSLSQADLIAFKWVSGHSTKNSRFLILTGDMPLTDPTSEWFPAITGRISIATVQGNEWDKSRNFNDVLVTSRNLQYCADQSPDCIVKWLDENHISIDYIYIRNLVSRVGEVPEPIANGLPMQFITRGDYKVVYETDEISILKVK